MEMDMLYKAVLCARQHYTRMRCITTHRIWLSCTRTACTSRDTLCIEVNPLRGFDVGSDNENPHASNN